MINLMTPIDCYTGYGITGYNIWKEIYNSNNSTTLFMIGQGNVSPDWNTDHLRKSINNVLDFNKNNPCLKIWHGNDFFSRCAGNSPYFGLSFFEIDKLTKNEVVSYNLLDKVFMPSNWAKNVLIDNGITKNIEICPMGVDRNIFNGETPNDKLNDKYIFINIGKWEIRKGHDILVELFNDAFTEKDNVELWMLNHNPFLSEDGFKKWISLYKESKLKDKIRIYPRLPNQQILARVMSYSDCGIFPSRAEGWNNEAIEMMSMNKPVIITNYSAHTEYCNSQNSFLIDIDSIEPAIDHIWFNGYGNWAKFGNKQKEQTIEYMRYVYKNNIRSNINGLETAQNLSWQKTANFIQNAML